MGRLNSNNSVRMDRRADCPITEVPVLTLCRPGMRVLVDRSREQEEEQDQEVVLVVVSNLLADRHVRRRLEVAQEDPQ